MILNDALQFLERHTAAGKVTADDLRATMVGKVLVSLKPRLAGAMLTLVEKLVERWKKLAEEDKQKRIQEAKEKKRIAAEAEKARLEAERIAAEEAEKARLEAERVAAEEEKARLEAERIAA